MTEKDRGFFFDVLFPSPIPFQNKKKPPEQKKKEKRYTVTGTIIYKRKRHFFTMKDVRRILKNILEEDRGTPTGYLEFLRDWGEVELMMLDLLASQGGFLGGSPLFDTVKDLISLLSVGETKIPFVEK